MMNNPKVECHIDPIPHITVESHGMVYEYTITFYESDDLHGDIDDYLDRTTDSDSVEITDNIRRKHG